MRLKILLAILVLTGEQVIPDTLEGNDFVNYRPGFEVFRLPGISSNKVQEIIQDSVGYLWFATQDGLLKFDGQNWISYIHNDDNPNSVHYDYIESIFLDSRGILWLTHWQEGSLTSFDPADEIFTSYQNDPKNPESILPGEQSVVTEDRSGFIWIGGQNGLCRLDRSTGKFRRFQHNPSDPSSLSCDRVRALYIDRKGTLWVGTGFPWEEDARLLTDGGLNRYNPESENFTRYMHDPNDLTSLADNKVRAMLEDSRGNFWVGTGGDGLQLMDRQTGRFLRLSWDPRNPGKLTRPYVKGTGPSALPSYSHVTSIFEDNKHRIWITAAEGGLNIYDPESGITKHFEKGPGIYDLQTNFIWKTFQSRDHTVWICTGGDGGAVYKVKDNDFQFPFYRYRGKPAEQLPEVHGILKDNEGRVWIAQSNPAKILRIDRRKGSEEEIPAVGLSGSRDIYVSGLTQDASGNIWISTWVGFYRCKKNESEFKPFRPAKFPGGDPLLSPTPVFQSRDGHYWFALWLDGGLIRYDPKTEEVVHFRNDPENPATIAGNRIFGLYEDKSGNLWIGGGSQARDQDRPLFLDRYNPLTNSFEHFIENKSLRGLAYDITSDEKGNIWFIDFSSSLYKLNPVTRELKKFNSSNGLFPKSQFYSLKRAETGKLWLCTESNLLEFDPETEVLSVFDEKQGVKTILNSNSSGNVAADGEMLFARGNGFHYFYPDMFSEKRKIVPDVRITGIQIFDEQTNSSNLGPTKNLASFTSRGGNHIRLNYRENIFSFSLASFDFYNSEPERLIYKLEGFDKGWRNDLKNGTTPYYMNVPPGSYTFHLKGTNKYGFRNDESVNLHITVMPPWWKSVWAYVFYGFIFAGAVFAVDRVQRRRIRNKERDLAKEKELQQAREIEKAYLNLKTTQTQLLHSEKMASLGELTAGIAHEIQNPLNFVTNFSDLNDELIDELEENIRLGNFEEIPSIANNIRENQRKIKHHGKTAESIVKAMLLHSQESSGRKELTDINALANEFLRLSYHGFRAKNNSFKSDFVLEAGDFLPKIRVVPQDIGRVFLNLLNNAFYAVNESSKQNQPDFRPRVIVRTKMTDGNIVISVHDNGDGIPENIRDKIFQPFFTTKPSGVGTGLGLSLSYDIITKGHSGDLKVESAENSGSAFIITLPVNT